LGPVFLFFLPIGRVKGVLMEKEVISKKLSRFGRCNRGFFPYIEKVLMRLPEEICQSFLDDPSFDMVSFKDALGMFCPFSSEIKALIILNGDILKEPEFQIIHTIAHEIAHKVIGKGESGLYEKEAEELLVKWGFQEEVEKVDYARTWLEGGGYKTGYEWAAKQDDLRRFEEYYDEWDQGKLFGERWDELFYEADPLSIQHEMGQLAEGTEVKAEDDLSKIPSKTVIDFDGSHERGIVYGIMSYLKKKKENALKNLSGPELSQSELDELFWLKLKEAVLACERIFDNRIAPVTFDYSEKYPAINGFRHFLIEVGGLLEELGKR
jgi:hypothetical protein